MLLYEKKEKPTVFLHSSLWKTGLLSKRQTESQGGYKEAYPGNPFSIRERGEGLLSFPFLQTRSDLKFIVSPVVTFLSLQGPTELFPRQSWGCMMQHEVR